MTETYSVQTIRDYLLGQLSESETERLDELSVTDDECAELIRAVEHDLADAYACGELRGTALEQFRSRMLTTPRQREAVDFAEALQSLGEGASLRSLPESSQGAAQTGAGTLRFRWALAAAVILATASVWLMLDNRTLRERVTSAELQRDRQLRETEGRQAPDPAPRPPGPGPSLQAVATLVLMPQLRGVGQLPTVALAGGTGDLAVQLDLEPVDYPSYDASLLASTGGQLLWRADRLIARSVGGRKTIDLRLPATVLSPQDYLIRVSGIPARGASEIVGEYRFTVVR
jgi:hypothetical protein